MEDMLCNFQEDHLKMSSSGYLEMLLRRPTNLEVNMVMIYRLSSSISFCQISTKFGKIARKSFLKSSKPNIKKKSLN